MSDNTTRLENCLVEKRRRQRTAVDPNCSRNVYFLDKRSEQKASALVHLPSTEKLLVGVDNEVYNCCICDCNLVFDEELNMYIKRHVNSEYDKYPKFAVASQTALQQAKPVCKLEKVQRVDVEVTAHPSEFVSFADRILEMASLDNKLNPIPPEPIKKYNKRRSYEVVD